MARLNKGFPFNLLNLNRKKTLIKLCATLILLVTVTGCVSIKHDYPRPDSTTFQDTENTYLGKKLAGIADSQPPGYSGFYPLNNGIDALAARLILAGRAERSIDLQYYLIKNDMVGKEFLRSLLSAADRGVRIRLLLDDVFTRGYDAGITALDSHENIQIRIFNPFNRGAAGRVISSTASFTRINRRMHNKSFTIDNQITVIGGRNIADEYFGAREDENFADLDVVGIGPIVQEVSTLFDTYWNHETAIPVRAFMPKLEDNEAELKRVSLLLEDAYKNILASEYEEAVKSKILAFMDTTDNDAFQWSNYQLVYDSPDKGIKSEAKNALFITTALADSIGSAEKEVLIVSPYFVPRKEGINALREKQRRGVQVTILTNSMAANNHLMVHSGYAPSRKPLLQQEVKIYEIRPDSQIDGAEFAAASGAKATLHTKAFIIDRKDLFIGSFNFDPRSANINTEMGVIIKNPELADYFADRAEAALKTEAFEVFLDNKRNLRWRGWEDGNEVIYDKEPLTKWSQRFMARLLGLFPIKGQL